MSNVKGLEVTCLDLVPTRILVRGEWTLYEGRRVERFLVDVKGEPFDGGQEATIERRLFLNAATALSWVESWALPWEEVLPQDFLVTLADVVAFTEALW